jgi:hypothetical protein
MAKPNFRELNDKRSSKYGANAGRPGGGTNDSGACWRLYIWSVNRDLPEIDYLALAEIYWQWGSGNSPEERFLESLFAP